MTQLECTTEQVATPGRKTVTGVVAPSNLAKLESLIRERTVEVLDSLPEDMSEQNLYRQLRFMAKVNLYEQFIWNFLVGKVFLLIA